MPLSFQYEVSKQVNNTVAVLAFFGQQKGPGNSNKNN